MTKKLELMPSAFCFHPFSRMGSARNWVLPAASILALVLIGAGAWYQEEISRDLGRLTLWVADSGPAAPVLYTLIYTFATVLMLPAFPLKLGAGFLFGFWKGAFMALLAGTIAASAAFLTGRFLTRGWVTRRLANNERFQRLDEAVSREGWIIVLLSRLSVVLPYNLLNYAFGLSDVGLKAFATATWVGMIPLTLVYAWFGSMAHDLADLSFSPGKAAPIPWWLYGTGIAATIGVTVFLARMAHRVLQHKKV